VVLYENGTMLHEEDRMVDFFLYALKRDSYLLQLIDKYKLVEESYYFVSLN
jgi:hypothetical protein